MKKLFRSLAVTAIVGAVLMLPDRVFSVPIAALTKAGAAAAPHVEGEVLVKFRQTATLEGRTLSLAGRSHGILADLDQGGWVRVKIAPGQAVALALAAYQDDPNVEFVQPNYIYHISAAPNDPQYGQLWPFRNTGQTVTNAFTQPPSSPLGYATDNPGTSGNDLNIEKAWDHITDCSGVVVAVVDSGVNYNHADLSGNMWSSGIYPLHGYNFVDNNNDPMDKNGHGTHVAGIIGAVGNNGFGSTGVCWKASIMAVRVMDATGSGSTATIIQGINFAVSNGAKVINMSLGGGAFDPAFSAAINTAQAADVVVVVAAGNSGANNDSGTTPTYPCNFTQPNLICVAALDQSYQLASFSNYGPTSVDVGAPGTNVLSTWAGTSAAITDPLTGGWTFTTTTSGGWAAGILNVGIPMEFLLDPAAYPGGQYSSSTDDRAYKSFNLAGPSVAVIQFGAAVNVVNTDFFQVGCVNTGGDPFAGGGTTVFSGTNIATYPYIFPVAFDISNCISASSSVGFRLQSGAALPKDRGVGIMQFSIETLALNATSYNTINGTSMATPEVAGLATMLRAYNPLYTATDVVNSVKNAGRSIASLAGKTGTGRAIDVMSSLAFINPPSGLSYTVQ